MAKLIDDQVAFENHTKWNLSARVREEKTPSAAGVRMVVEIWPDERGQPVTLVHGQEALAELTKLRGN